MADKSIEEVVVRVDEAAPASPGWVAHDVRGRLVTEPGPGGKVRQRVAVTGAVQFDDAARGTDPSEAGGAPPVMLTLGRRGSESLPSHRLLFPRHAETVAGRSIRFTETSDSWHRSTALSPADLDLRLTGYDLGNVHELFWELPPEQATAIPVTVQDRSALSSLRIKVDARAETMTSTLGSCLRFSAEGVIERGSAEQFRADRDALGPDPLALRPGVPVPGFVVEFTDDSDFLLDRRTIRLHGAIPVSMTTEAPRFLTSVRLESGLWAGTPTRVTVRILDDADVR